jgi:hypothetical protein
MKNTKKTIFVTVALLALLCFGFWYDRLPKSSEAAVFKASSKVNPDFQVETILKSAPTQIGNLTFYENQSGTVSVALTNPVFSGYRTDYQAGTLQLTSSGKSDRYASFYTVAFSSASGKKQWISYAILYDRAIQRISSGTGGPDYTITTLKGKSVRVAYLVWEGDDQLPTDGPYFYTAGGACFNNPTEA